MKTRTMGDEELDKAINLLSSVDFRHFRSQVGSGQPHMLNDVRNDLSTLDKARTDLINSTARLKGGVTGSSMPLRMLTPRPEPWRVGQARPAVRHQSRNWR